MSLKKLKNWFMRHRGEARIEEEPPAPAPPEAKRPVHEPGPAPMPGKPPAGPKSGKKKSTPKKSKRTRPASAKLSSEKNVSTRPLSRQGIPLLEPDEDLTAHFRDPAADGTGSEPATVKSGLAAPRKTITTSSGQTPAEPVRRNRVGIRRLDDEADLNDYFLTATDDAPEQKTPDPQASADTKHTGRAPFAGLPTDRHGIPRLDNQADLNRIFDAAADEKAEGEDWGEAMRQSLDHDARSLMKKKTGGSYPSRRLTLKEKLQRYPSPQAQLDLHGATAAKARQRADAFMRRARTDGLFTVRIIVGKGLHSESGAVLPDVIEDLLVVLKREDLVLSYRWEKRVKRKSGAVIVFLATDFR